METTIYGKWKSPILDIILTPEVELVLATIQKVTTTSYGGGCHFLYRYVLQSIIVTDSILKRLGVEREFFSYMACGDSSYLADLEDKSISYVNVEAELQEIENKCSMCGIPCYRHTMPALNWIADKQR